VRFGARVKSLAVDSTTRAVTGVVLTSSPDNQDAVSSDGSDHIHAAQVVVNGDLAAAEERLFCGTALEAEARSFQNKELSCSVIAFHWALRTQLPTLSHHNVFLATDPGGGGGWDNKRARPLDEPRRRLAWDWVNRLRLGDDAASEAVGGADVEGLCNFYVHAPSRTDPSACPPDTDAITVLVPCAPTNGECAGEDADERNLEAAQVTAARSLVMERFKCAGMEPDIVAERVLRPTHWRDSLGLKRGAAFGLGHQLSQVRVGLMIDLQ
jgi:phytoene dehydrogenase-like protein